MGKLYKLGELDLKFLRAECANDLNKEVLETIFVNTNVVISIGS